MTGGRNTTVEALFRDVFLPLYPEDARGDLDRARREDANPANNPNVFAHLEDAARVFVRMAPSVLGIDEAALDFSDASVHRLSAALTIEKRDALLRSGTGADNALFNVVVHGAAYVGACVVRTHGGRWSARRPLWESVVVLKSRAGEAALPIFHWWLKSLVDPEKASLADRYRAFVEVPCATPEELPMIAPRDRSLPKLVKVSYHALIQYLRAHLPELRDVGEAFPSPERIDDLAFEHLSFALVGGGRMLVISGPNKHGLHAFWLNKNGFEKAAFWPADAFPAPMLKPKTDDDKLEVILSKDGAPVSFELLWWGP